MNLAVVRGEARLLWTGLIRNLSAGMRLALFMRVTPTHFRASPAHLIVLLGFNILFWFGADYWFVGSAGSLDPNALTIFLARIALALLVGTIIAGVLARGELVLKLLVMWCAADWLFEVVYMVRALPAIDALSDAPMATTAVLNGTLIAWPLLIMLRAIIVAGHWSRWRTLAALALTVMLFGALAAAIPRPVLWRTRTDATLAASGIEQEVLFHRQPQLLARALNRLAASHSYEPELYFLGVSPYASQDVFLREMRSVARILERRFQIADRSILLLNNPATLGDFPMASTTYLRAALSRFGERMDVSKDILIFFITTHGGRNHDLAFDLPPLALDPLRPDELVDMFEESGVKWRVIVISACYSGGFVDALKDPYTIVITASDANSTSFGCAHENEWTNFGEAFFNEGMERTPSFIEAFEIAREQVARREKEGRLEPSNPQIFVGEAIRERLDALARR